MGIRRIPARRTGSKLKAPRRIIAQRLDSQPIPTPDPWLELGNRIERMLLSWNISKEWWLEFKEKHGYPPTCSCDARKEWFNQMEQDLPKSLRWVVAKLIDALTRGIPD